MMSLDQMAMERVPSELAIVVVAEREEQMDWSKKHSMEDRGHRCYYRVDFCLALKEEHSMELDYWFVLDTLKKTK